MLRLPRADISRAGSYRRPMDVTPLLQSLNQWARACDGVVALGIVGSHARGSPRRESDVDVIVIANDPDRFIDETAWVGRFGRLTSPTVEDYGLVRSLRCVDGAGGEIEFGIAGRDWCTPPIDAATARVIRDGLLMVYDPGRHLRLAAAWVARHGDPET